jgi:hypothetical protein
MITAGQVTLAARAIKDHENATKALRRFREWAGTSPEPVPVEVRTGDGQSAVDRLRVEVPRQVVEGELLRQVATIENELRALGVIFEAQAPGAYDNLRSLPVVRRVGPI